MIGSTQIKKIPKSQMLREWMKNSPWFTKRQLMQWGSDCYYLRAVRQAQEMCAVGELERLNVSQQYDLGIIQGGQDEIAAWRVKK